MLQVQKAFRNGTMKIFTTVTQDIKQKPLPVAPVQLTGILGDSCTTASISANFPRYILLASVAGAQHVNTTISCTADWGNSRRVISTSLNVSLGWNFG